MILIHTKENRSKVKFLWEANHTKDSLVQHVMDDDGRRLMILYAVLFVYARVTIFRELYKSVGVTCITEI